MKALFVLLVCSLLLITINSVNCSDDFQFENNDDLQLELQMPASTLEYSTLHINAYVGKLIAFAIPIDTFTGKVSKFEVDDVPAWLQFDNQSGIFQGVPSEKDEKNSLVSINANTKNEEVMRTAFSIQVHNPDELHAISEKGTCPYYKENVYLYLIVSGELEELTAKERVHLINKLSDFFNIQNTDITIRRISTSDIEQLSDRAIKYGYGSSKGSKDLLTSVEIDLGCSENVLIKYKYFFNQLRKSSRDSVASEIMGMPLIKWIVVPKLEDNNRNRLRRDVEGSAEYEYDSDYDSEYDDDGEEEGRTVQPTVTNITTPKSIVPEITSAKGTSDDFIEESHATPDGQPPNVTSYERNIADSVNKIDIDVSKNNVYDDDYGNEDNNTVEPTNMVPIVAVIDNTPVSPIDHGVQPTTSVEDVEPRTFTVSPISTNDLPSIQTEIETIPTSHNVSTTGDNTTSSSTVDADVVVTNVDQQENLANTTFFPSVSNNHVPFSVPNEEIKNNAPIIQHRLQKLPVTAGKAFTYIIPEDTFHDIEDGYDLQLTMHDSSGGALQYSSWVQFDPSSRKVYGLPLEEDVSRYEYIITATDKDEATISDTLEIIVQHHKGRRTVNHEITLSVQSEKRLKKNTEVDLRFRVLHGLAEVFGDPNFSQIIVTHVQTVVQPLQITWTNDSLPRNICPREEIENLLKKVRQSPDSTEPTIDLVRAMAPELRVKAVSGGGVGACTSLDIPPPPKAPAQNFAPMPRNQVDHLNATVGQLLVYKVPEDSFYDPEDGNARSLKLYLLNIDRAPLAPAHWLQFDIKNQEFYGIPKGSDVGHRQYLLVCEDRGGLSATDGLVVAVHPASKTDYMVEFQIILDHSYDIFVNSATLQRKFVDKITELFGDRDSRYIKIDNIRVGSTIITWRNTSLTGSRCLQSEIDELKTFLLRDDGSLSHNVIKTMGSDFPVISAKMTPTGVCRGEFFIMNSPDLTVDTDSKISINQDHDDYFVTFVIPALIIIGMLILASFVACLLYKKRKVGKMELGDEEERQSFRNKGIPVIFQDELEEKPDPSNKSPLILKDEKPPLHPPPEYKGLESPQHTDNDDNCPYQPPPPFTCARSSNTNRINRPKPTPTYRKPPPYVPP